MDWAVEPRALRAEDAEGRNVAHLAVEKGHMEPWSTPPLGVGGEWDGGGRMEGRSSGPAWVFGAEMMVWKQAWKQWKRMVLSGGQVPNRSVPKAKFDFSQKLDVVCALIKRWGH